ncbi:MAG: hypothetical protein LAN64_12020 [Acidobacteriia bacterium]|nr:hypothetical protein [Terriglobia bacterium]
MQRGFALISALLLLMLMSALAVAVLIKVNTEQRLQKTDSGNNLAYYGAEAGMEKMTADLGTLYVLNAAPNWCDITNLQTGFPSFADVGVTYSTYAITIPVPPAGCAAPPSRVQTISQGPNAGLYAQIVPLTLQVTAFRPGGEEVSMVRQVEVALIPVFQFGVFSESDLSFFPGPPFDFNGRTQTNGNLFLAAEGTLTFHTFIRAAKDVVRDQLASGASSTSNPARTAAINIPKQPAGCDGAQPACRNLTVAPNEGSSIGGPSATYGGTGAVNPNWTSLSTSTYKSMILSGSTGVKPLSLSFVQSGVNPIEILRRPAPGESVNSAVGESRLYNQAQIRVLLSDDPDELPGGASDADNIRLADVQTNATAPDYSQGVTAAVPTGLPAMPSGSGKPYVTYFAEGSTAVQDPSSWSGSSAQFCLPSDWATVPSTPAPASSSFTLLNYESKPVNVADARAAVFTAPTTGYAPFIGTANPTSPNPVCFATATQAAAMVPVQAASAPAAPGTTWNLIDGYLRVEIRQADNTFLPVTKEWLELGFARGLTPPTAAAPNPVHPNAILLFQQPADRNGNGSLDPRVDAVQTTAKVATNPPCGGYRQPACIYQTVVNAKGIEKPAEVQTDTHSNSVYYGDGNDSTSVTRYNWYPITFYDAREGELRENSRASTTCSVGGVMNAVEIDVKNLQRWLNGTTGTNGKLTEAVSQNGYVLYFSDRRGMLPNPNAGTVKNGEYGFEDIINPAVALGTPNGTMDTGEDADGNGRLDTWGAANLGLGFGAGKSGNPAATVDCTSMARKNWISGARRAVRLVDGSRGNVPVRWDTTPVGGGGFTVASENPAYILGDYNASGGFTGAHASSAVIADTVTLLSNSWTDRESLTSPADDGGRSGATTYFRVAIASGKNINFPIPTWAGNPTVPRDFGTDGGVHNFLRYLENWGGSSSNYMGSMVSLYYSQYATGIFKCCGTVYSPPNRNYAFDLDFQDVTKLPPGTPKFRDVVDVGFQQVF